MKRARMIALTLALLVMGLLASASPAPAEIRHCITYDFAGSELCVGEYGVEGLDRFTPWNEPTWFCVIYTFSGGQICASTDGQIDQDRSH